MLKYNVVILDKSSGELFCLENILNTRPEEIRLRLQICRLGDLCKIKCDFILLVRV